MVGPPGFEPGLLRLKGGYASHMSVPKILTPYIPEILSLPAIAGKVRNLPMLRFVVVSRAERREEDVRDVEATRDRSLAEGWPREDRGGPFGGSFAELRQAYRGRRSGRPCRCYRRARTAEDWPAEHRREFPENPSSRSCKRRPTCRPWKSCASSG